MTATKHRRVSDRLNVAGIEARILQIAQLLEWAKPMAVGLVNEFFTKDSWQNMPSSWRQPLENLPLAELSGLLLSPPENLSAVWPLSLLSFLSAVHALRLPGQLRRRNIEPEVAVRTNGRCAEETAVNSSLWRSVTPKKVHEMVRLSALADEVARHARCDTLVDIGSGQGYLSRVLAFEFNWHVVALEASEQNVRAAERLDTSVQRTLMNRIAKARGGLAAGQKRRPPATRWNPQSGSVHHIVTRLPPITLDSEAFQALISPAPAACNDSGMRGTSGAADSISAHSAGLQSLESFSCANDVQVGDDSGRACEASEVACEASGRASEASGRACEACEPAGVALVGLHTCGELACTMLRLFDSAGEAVRVVISVGCCYMHLTEKTSDVAEMSGEAADSSPNSSEISSLPNPVEKTWRVASGPGQCEETRTTVSGYDCCYPMSEFLSALALPPLGFHILELSCHSIHAYADRISNCAARGEEGEALLRQHCRRAVLQLILSERYAGYQHSSSVNSIKGAHLMPFDEYVNACLTKLKLPCLRPDERQELFVAYTPALELWRRVLVMIVIRNLLAPLWEAVILLDRLLFLAEKGHRAALVPLFDPLFSPRNYALVGLKSAADAAWFARMIATAVKNGNNIKDASLADAIFIL